MGDLLSRRRDRFDRLISEKEGSRDDLFRTGGSRALCLNPTAVPVRARFGVILSLNDREYVVSISFFLGGETVDDIMQIRPNLKQDNRNLVDELG